MKVMAMMALTLIRVMMCMFDDVDHDYDDTLDGLDEWMYNLHS